MADQGDADDDALDIIVRPALDKPRNWFAGDRQAIVKLPFRPVQKIKRVTLKLVGFGATSVDIPLDRIRLTNNGFSLVPGQNGYILPNNTRLMNYWQFNDGMRLPGGLEVVFDAGLGKRGLKQYPASKRLFCCKRPFCVWWPSTPNSAAGFSVSNCLQTA